MSRPLLITAACAFVALATAGGLWWHRSANANVPGAEKTPAKAASPSPGGGAVLPVALYTVKPQTMDLGVPATGTLLARESVELVAETSRRLVNIRTEEGKRVEKGDILFVLDSAELNAQLKQLRVQERLAKTTAARDEKLFEQGLIPTSQRDIVAARVDELAAQRQVLGVALSKTVIRAPFAGVMGLRRVSEGAWVSPSTVLATLHDTSQLKLDFTLPERYSSLVKVGGAFQFSVPGRTKAYRGTISAFEPQIDAASRSVLVRGVVEETGDLLPGNFANVVLPLSEQGSLMVPTIAVVPGLDGRRVFVERDGEAKGVLVELGARSGDLVQVVSGLSAGDRVITNNLLRMRDGVRVKVIAGSE